MQLFHRTNIATAREIIRNGFVDEKWRFGRDDVTGQAIEAVGVWLSDRPLTPDEGPIGDAVVEISLAADEAALQRFELRGPTNNARLWVVPARLVNRRGSFRIHEVDPRTSWFHEGVGEPDREEWDDDETDDADEF